MLLLAGMLVSSRAIAEEPSIELRIEADGSVDLDGEHITDQARLESAVKALVARNPPPVIHLQPGNGVSFERLGQIIQLMQKAGIPKIGFITGPPK